MPELIVGSPPRGEDYFGQNELIEDLWARLKKDNVLLVAPRRFGKTGAMYKLLDEPRKPFHPIYLDVEHIECAADFMVELIANLIRDKQFKRAVNALWKGTKGLGEFLRDLPASIELGGVKVELRERTDISENWLSYGERIMSLIAEDGPPLLLLIDEFAVMINNVAQANASEVRQLLRWFRAARTAPNTQTRFVIGGSINLLSTLDSMGLVDTVNDLSIVRLQPFDAETARAFIAAIFESRNMKAAPEIITTILDLVGAPIPYLLAVLLASVFERQRATKGAISREMIEAAFEEDLLGGSASAFFRQYRSRIDQYYPGLEGQSAKAILGTLSRAAAPVRRDQLFQIYLRTGNVQPTPEAKDSFMQLMHKLDNDFYILSRDDSYEFFSRVIKLWWKSHYGFHGV